MLIDTHAHLYWESFKEDFDQMIQRAVAAGITAIINIGVDVRKSREALRQAQGKLANIPGLSVYSTIGIHPHETIKYIQGQTYHGRDINVQEAIAGDIAQLEEIYLSSPKKVVAVGECGLDYFFREEDSRVDPQSGSPRNDEAGVKDLQKKLFQAQIDLAKKLNLPLIVHCRDDRSKDPTNSEAWDTALEMVGNYPAILHCYSGLSHTTYYILSRSSTKSRSRILDEQSSSGQTTNLVVSFAANITYPKNEYLREAAKILPLDRILLETDSPFLTPQSKRGQRNEPAAVKEVAELIADLKGISFEEVATQTTKNAKKVFNI